MDKTKKYLAFSFVMVLVAVTIVSVIGMILLDRKPVVLQGQIEATEIRISGKLPGRIDRFLVEEGERVAAGDTLVVINSPEALAKYEQVQALEDVAVYQNPEDRRRNASADRRVDEAAMGQGQGRPEAGPDDPRTDRVALPRQRRHVAAPRRGGSALSECVGRASGLPTSSTEWLWTGP